MQKKFGLPHIWPNHRVGESKRSHGTVHITKKKYIENRLFAIIRSVQGLFRFAISSRLKAKEKKKKRSDKLTDKNTHKHKIYFRFRFQYNLIVRVESIGILFSMTYLFCERVWHNY